MDLFHCIVSLMFIFLNERFQKFFITGNGANIVIILFHDISFKLATTSSKEAKFSIDFAF